ncbi:MAG: rod shape-determining protein MreC [Thermoleophilia bacterium]
MNDDLDRSLTALMEHAAAPAEPARVDDTRRQALEGLARACRQARRRRITSVVGTGVLVAGVAAFLVMALPKGDPSEPSGTTTSTAQRLPKPTRAEAPNRPGRWWLYPDRSRVGQAAAAAVGAPAKWVEARRQLRGGVLTGADAVSLRDEQKHGWELDWSVAFARWELTFPSTRTTGGEYWIGSQDRTFSSLYFVSDDGVSVWVGHYSSPKTEAPTTARLISMAKRFVAELRKRGDFRSRVLDPPTGRVTPDLRGYAMVPATVVAIAVLPWWDQVRINRGRRDGVRVGAAVLEGTPPGAMVGVVTEADRASSIVSFLRSGRTRVLVTIEGGGSSISPLQTTASRQLRITRLPASAPVAPGQAVFTAGVSGSDRPSLIPRGLSLGFVDRVQEEPGGGRTAVITPSTDPRDTATLTVLRPR